jgi:hypothetical protein
MTYPTELADTADLETMIDIAELEAADGSDDAERYRETARELREIVSRRSER